MSLLRIGAVIRILAVLINFMCIYSDETPLSEQRACVSYGIVSTISTVVFCF